MENMCLHGGSVMIASKRPPRLHPFLVTSNVKQSSIRFRKPYFVAARKTPGPDASVKQIRASAGQHCQVTEFVSLSGSSNQPRRTHPSLASACRRYRSRRPSIPNAHRCKAGFPSPQTDRIRTFLQKTVCKGRKSANRSNLAGRSFLYLNGELTSVCPAISKLISLSIDVFP
jgi:hypothetical protein